jgi:hypothetical protein
VKAKFEVAARSSNRGRLIGRRDFSDAGVAIAQLALSDLLEALAACAKWPQSLSCVQFF